MNQHFDAERLAAFAEGSLSPAERAAAEAHAADCSECLQLLAVLARTHEEAQRSPSVWRLPTFVRWVAPLAAAATAVTLWLNLTRAPRPADQQSQHRRLSNEQAKAIDSAGAANADRMETDRPATPSPSADVGMPGRSSGRPNDRSASAAAPAEKREAFDRLGKRAQTAEPSRRFETRSDTKRSPDEERSATAPPALADAPRAQLPAAPVSPAPSASELAAAGAAKPAATPPPAVAETVTTEREAAAVAGAKSVRQRFATASLVLGASPDGRYRWRVNGTLVERSVDGGATWAVVPGMPGAQVSAIAAPTSNVAWFAGGAGTVLVWVDDTWSRVVFPEKVDLTSVRALGAREAFVTTADGRTFRTTDGGLTWSLQQNHPSPF